MGVNMFFNFDPPSISYIRAKLLIEKLNELPSSFSSISLCATGRTGSGKTTLGNRLLGVDYFMPSTGEQDCTDEVNVVEFPSGLKYFDLPGVASKGKLENYNRAALGIEQRGKFQNIEDLTLAQYSVGSQPRKNIFTVSEFEQRQILEPDLILYTIAPDKQFLDVDCLYLGDLLSRYSQVIYVFNMFADKQTGTIYATEPNIKDVATRIKEVHTFVLGEESQPIVVPMNCWTGEGISDLVSRAADILGSEKGSLFEELINHQRRNAPDDYLRQVKHKLIDVLAYASCQKPDGIYTCDRPIHKICHHVLEFLVDLNVQSKQGSDSSEPWIKRAIDEALSWEFQQFIQGLDVSPEKKIESLQVGFSSLQYGIDILNQLIKVDLAEASSQAIELRNTETMAFASDVQACEKQIKILKKEGNSKLKKYNRIGNKIDSISKTIDRCQEKRNSLIDKFNSLNQQISSRIDAHNASANSLRSFISDLDSRIDRYNFRREKFNVRIDAIKSTAASLKASSYRVSESAIRSLQSEIDSVNREETSLEKEEGSLKELISQRDQRISNLEDEKRSLRQMIVKRDRLEKRIDREEKRIERQGEKGIASVNLRQSTQQAIEENIKLLAIQYKHHQDIVEIGRAILDNFNDELEAISGKIDSRIEEINSRIAIVRDLHTGLSELEDVSQEQISSLRERVNDCLEEMQLFDEEIERFKRELRICSYKISINKLIGDAMRECTTHHFDSTGEFEYRGSTYDYFNEKGLAIVLSLTHLAVLSNEIGSDSSSLLEKVSSLLGQLGDFPNNSDTTEVANWLKPRIGQLFTTSFDKMLGQAIL
jgi:peptidoglycan hydrolase CwlO-like protein